MLLCEWKEWRSKNGENTIVHWPPEQKKTVALLVWTTRQQRQKVNERKEGSKKGQLNNSKARSGRNYLERSK